MTIRTILTSFIVAALLSACGGVIDNCPSGLPDGPPGAPMHR
jgi:uncharacterized protein YceK